MGNGIIKVIHVHCLAIAAPNHPTNPSQAKSPRRLNSSNDVKVAWIQRSINLPATGRRFNGSIWQGNCGADRLTHAFMLLLVLPLLLCSTRGPAPRSGRMKLGQLHVYYYHSATDITDEWAAVIRGHCINIDPRFINPRSLLALFCAPLWVGFFTSLLQQKTAPSHVHKYRPVSIFRFVPIAAGPIASYLRAKRCIPRVMFASARACERIFVCLCFIFSLQPIVTSDIFIPIHGQIWMKFIHTHTHPFDVVLERRNHKISFSMHSALV